MWFVPLLVLFLDLTVVVDAQCPSQNLVDSHDNRFQWSAVINGESADTLLDPTNNKVYKTNSAPNTVRMNIKINYAALKLQEVSIETNHAVLIRLQNYALTDAPGTGWHTTTFTFQDEDNLADQIVFLVTGRENQVQVRNAYVRGCLQINPCDSHLNSVFQSLQKDFYHSLKVRDMADVGGFFTEKAVIIKQGVPIIQGTDDIVSYYTSNPVNIATIIDVRVLRAVQLTENRVYTVHLVISYNDDKSVKGPIKRIFTLWNKENESWKIDVASINE